jgi:uncharacterized phage protein (TIGR02218 family)
MKTSTAELNAALYNVNVFRVANLYTFTFAGGVEKRWTSHDVDVSWGGNTWDADEVAITEEPTISSGLGEVDACEMAFAPGTATIPGGLTYKAMGIRHLFDRVPVLVQRAYYASDGSVAGVVHLFEGWIEDAEVGSTEIRLTFKSLAARLEESLPRRVIQPACPYQVYDASTCKLNKASWTNARTVAAGSSTTMVKLSSTTTMAIPGSWLEFTSGNLSGTKATILSVSVADCTLAVPLLAVPDTGSNVSVVKGCPKTRTACNAFSNIANFGGFPDSPPPESL